MSKKLFFFAALGLFAAGLSGCASVFGKDEASVEFDKETSSDDAKVRETKTRTALSALEAGVADYVKTENKVPAKLELLVPKYLAEIPSLDVPECRGESNSVQNYPPVILRDGQVDGAMLKGTGRWGYVYNDTRVVIFVDCLKPSSSGVPWYQMRGIY
ncbi:MAG TPA: hypothetical protein VN915_05145 [Elusimicrobiota bacterium]|nr:hypothetical protein [Elusimicrobiota bacterium]